MIKNMLVLMDEVNNNTLLFKRSDLGDIIPLNDSTEVMPNVDKLWLEVDAYDWYAQGYRCPVFKILLASLKNGEQKII